MRKCTSVYGGGCKQCEWRTMGWGVCVSMCSCEPMYIKLSTPSRSPVVGNHDAPLNPLPPRNSEEEALLPGDPHLLVLSGPQGQASRASKLFPTF